MTSNTYLTSSKIAQELRGAGFKIGNTFADRELFRSKVAYRTKKWGDRLVPEYELEAATAHLSKLLKDQDAQRAAKVRPVVVKAETAPAVQQTLFTAPQLTDTFTIDPVQESVAALRGEVFGMTVAINELKQQIAKLLTKLA